MLENFDKIQNIPWELIALGGFFVTNFIIIIISQVKIQNLQEAKLVSDKHLHELAGDVKALYESGTTLGSQIKKLEFNNKILREEQEQLSLKEPSQQIYKNALQLINNGESVNKISQSSGLARGEIELLKLFQRIDSETKKEKDISIK